MVFSFKYNFFFSLTLRFLDKPELSDELQYVSLITISNEECKNVYGYQVSSDMVCAAGNYQEGTCLVRTITIFAKFFIFFCFFLGRYWESSH